MNIHKKPAFWSFLNSSYQVVLQDNLAGVEKDKNEKKES